MYTRVNNNKDNIFYTSKMLRPSYADYELESLGLSTEQIHRVKTRLPPESIKLFITNWKQRQLHETTKEKTSLGSSQVDERLHDIAHRLFGTPPPNGFSKEYLHKKFKILAHTFHPDRPNGSAESFKVLIDSYAYLCKALKAVDMNSDKTDILDKKEASMNSVYERYTDNRHIIENANAPPTSLYKNTSFDTRAFNTFFDKNALKDPNQGGGYGSWLKENDGQSMQPKSRPTENNFNESFESIRDSYSKKASITTLVNRKVVPDANHCDSQYSQCAQLGVGKVDDYSGRTETIQYADLKRVNERPHLIYENASHISNEYTRDTFEVAVEKNKACPSPLSSLEVMQLEEIKHAQQEEDELRNYMLRQYDEDIEAHAKKVGSHFITRDTRR